MITPAHTPFNAVAGIAEKAFILTVEEGEDAMTSLLLQFARSGYRSAATVMLHGSVQRLSLFTGKPTGDPARPATFSGPHQIECPAIPVSGTGAIGPDEQGYALVMHAHLLFCDANGNLRGCHLAENECIAGADGLAFAVFPTSDGIFQKQRDPATGFGIFFPRHASTESIDP